MKPIFSIIIPVREINPYLKETLSKLKKQTSNNFEILIITDKISNTANPAKKRNLGAKMAKSEYLAFLDDDSYPSKNYFKNAEKLIKKYPEYGGFCGPCLTPKNDNLFQKTSGMVWSTWLGSGGAGVYRNSIQTARFVDDYPSVNLIIKKKDFNKVGGFITSYWPGEDTLLCLNLTRKLNKKIFYHPSLVVYHHRRAIITCHLQQITRYAIHRGFFARKFPQTSLKIGYFTPTIFTLYIISIFIFSQYQLYLLPLYLYLSILILTFFKLILDERSIILAFLTIITIPITHIYYGILFLYGFFKKDIRFKPHTFNPKTGKYIGG